MVEVIDKVGPCTLQLRTEGTHFDALIRSIVYQQLSGKAAATIHGRVRALFDSETPLPPQVAAAEHDTLRKAGLSNQKAKYVRNLAEHSLNGSLPVETLHELTDQEIIEVCLSGGSGFGSPFERPLDAIARDLAEGYVTPEAAVRDYGVAIGPDGKLVAESPRRREA